LARVDDTRYSYERAGNFVRLEAQRGGSPPKRMRLEWRNGAFISIQGAKG
jgi:hypothetical protein